MTPAELEKEWNYRYQERLGNLCGAGEPTTEQKALAFEEAQEAVEALKESESSKPIG